MVLRVIGSNTQGDLEVARDSLVTIRTLAGPVTVTANLVEVVETGDPGAETIERCVVDMARKFALDAAEREREA